MARYNINVRTPSHIADTLSVEKEDLTELRLEMSKFVGELLKDHAALIWADQDWQVDLTNEDGLILYMLTISAMESPAVSKTQR